jgi:hypothetical protein
MAAQISKPVTRYTREGNPILVMPEDLSVPGNKPALEIISTSKYPTA